MKKILSSLLIVLIFFNFIFCSLSYAAGAEERDSELQESSTYLQSAPASNTIMTDIIDEGSVSQTQGSANKVSTASGSYGTSIVGFVIGLIARLLNIMIALQVDLIMGQLTYATENEELKYFITIDRLVFNRVPLLNINYFDTEDYEVGDLTLVANESNSEIKKSVSGVYYICRLLAMIIGLIVLIYIGIRMAISTVASDQAKYKKMLMSWVESILIIFLMPYIISFIINFGEILTGAFYEIRVGLLGNGERKVFENVVRSNAMASIFSASGLEVAMYSIIYWCLLFVEIKFLWTYLKRLFIVGFLIAIAPLITITYSIDKAGDGKAQAFSNWIKEFLLNVLIQPLHAIIYLIFILTANKIASDAPLVAIALLMSMGAAEKMVKVVFNINNSFTLKGIDSFFKRGK